MKLLLLSTFFVVLHGAPKCPKGEFLATGIEYEYAEEAMTCLAKKVTRCVQNKDSFGFCPIAADHVACLGKSQTDKTCIVKGDLNYWCPSGYTCAGWPMIAPEPGKPTGSCCNQTLYDEYDKELEPKCAGGKKLVKRSDDEYYTLLGRSCKDDFCPQGATCVQLKYLAHCCR